VAADTSCGSNSVLLFSARGSGDEYGAPLARNKVGAWTQGAGIELITEGWNVRDLQAIYPAPSVPSFGQIAKAAAAGALVRGAPGATAAVGLIVKQFRDSASGSWQSVKGELEAAHTRCPARKILLAGYSQGAILLRYIIPRLAPTILKQVVSVDLFADPTEQRAVDGELQHPANLDGRLTTEGIDTLAGLLLHGGQFRQTPYPPSIQRRVYQYCVDGDLVCDASLTNLDPRSAILEGKVHASYGFEINGIKAGKRLGAASGTPAAWTISPLGLGPIHFGMTVQHAQAVSGATIKVDPSINNCGFWSFPSLGKTNGIESFDKLEMLTPDNRIATAKGIRAGSTFAALRAAYPGRLRSTSTGEGGYARLAKKVDAEYALDQTVGGVRYSLDFMVGSGRVYGMIAGPWDFIKDWTECA